MQRTVEIFLVLGILINLVKGADLLLRPHQQKWLQAKCDTLALWLDYSRPVQWYMQPIVKLKIFWLSATALIVADCILSIIAWHIPVSKWPAVISLGIFGSVSMFMWLNRVLNEGDKTNSSSKPSNRWAVYGKNLEKNLVVWLLKSTTIIGLLARQSLLAVAGFISLPLLLCIPALAIIAISPHWSGWISGLAGGTLLIVIYYRRRIYAVLKAFGNVGVVSFFNLIFSLLLVIGELILKLLRGIMWRVADYNKGAFAAIVLIITIALGVTEFYLKFQPPASTRPVIATPSPTASS